METVSEQPKVWTRDSASGEKRHVWTALKRGLRGHNFFFGSRQRR